MSAVTGTTRQTTVNTTSNAFATWTDENTGRQVRQLTNCGEGDHVGMHYFRTPKHLPDGRIVISHGSGRRSGALVEPESGDIQPIENIPGGMLRLNEKTGHAWYLSREGDQRLLLDVDLVHDKVLNSRVLPAELDGKITDITADGQSLVLTENHQFMEGFDLPTTMDLDKFWKWFERPRYGRILVHHIATGECKQIVYSSGACPNHVEAHPTIPTYIRHTYDWWDGYHQRVWAINTDGTDHHPIRPQAHGELITHEFFFSDPQYVAFTYQDRRDDPAAHHRLPWGEYTPAPTQFGMTNLAGEQVYLSDPVNHYHTHLYCSRDGKMLSGSGTDGHSFVHAAHFSMKSTKVDYQKLATIHTPYIPFRGQGVNCDLSLDNKWMLYVDTIGDHRQLCAVSAEPD
jgi:hypothetical protein